MPESGAAAKLRSPRAEVLKHGVVAFNRRHSTVDCAIRDFSVAGCRVRSDAARLIPGTFELLIELDGLWYPGRAQWRKGNDVGVQFTGPPTEAKSRRVQAIEPTKPVSIRLRTK